MAHLWLPAAVLLFAKRTWAQGARTRTAADQSSRRAPSAAKDGLARPIIPYADSGRSRKNAVTSPLKGVLSQILDAKTEPDTALDGGCQSRARQVGAKLRTSYGPTAEFSARQRSTMDTSDMWFTLDDCGDPIWGQGVAS
jgi:hypothetical protein